MLETAFSPISDNSFNLAKYTLEAIERLTTGGLLQRPDVSSPSSFLQTSVRPTFPISGYSAGLEHEVDLVVSRARATSCTYIDIARFGKRADRLLGVYTHTFSGSATGLANLVLAGSLGIFTSSVVALTAYETPARQKLQVSPEAARALKTVHTLTTFLSITEEELGLIIGRGRTTITSWRNGTVPRSNGLALLYSIDATLNALRRNVGDHEALEWLRAGNPSRFDRMSIGKWDEVKSEASGILFSSEALEPKIVSLETMISTIVPAPKTKITQPTPTRVQLTKRDR